MGKKTKKKTTASATLFRFAENDPVVTENLTATEIAAVAHWQESVAYRFEFHEGHTSGGGKPIYIRPSALDDSRDGSIPKLNAVAANAGTYSVIAKIENGGKLTSNLDNTAQTDLMNIVLNEWATLVVLARRYWDNEDLPAAAQARRAMSCKCGAQVSGDVYVGPPNEHGKYKCPKCNSFNLK